MPPLSIPHPSHLRASHSSRVPPHLSHLAGFHCCLECLVLVVALGWPVPYLPLRPVASTASDCVVSAGPASVCIAVAPSSSLAVGLGFHLQSSPVCVASSVSFTSDVCILSPRQTKVNTFTDKDIEVLPETSVLPTKTQGKKIVVFLARWLGSPVSESKKHPSYVGRRLFDRILGQVRLASVKQFVDDRVELRFAREPASNRDRPLIPIAKPHKGPIESCEL